MLGSASVNNLTFLSSSTTPRPTRVCRCVHPTARHLVITASRQLRIYSCSQAAAAGAASRASEDQHLFGDVVLPQGQLAHATQVANISNPILSGGGGGIFFFWQLGRIS